MRPGDVKKLETHHKGLHVLINQSGFLSEFRIVGVKKRLNLSVY